MVYLISEWPLLQQYCGADMVLLPWVSLLLSTALPRKRKAELVWANISIIFMCLDTNVFVTIARYDSFSLRSCATLCRASGFIGNCCRRLVHYRTTLLRALLFGTESPNMFCPLIIGKITYWPYRYCKCMDICWAQPLSSCSTLLV